MIEDIFKTAEEEIRDFNDLEEVSGQNGFEYFDNDDNEPSELEFN